MNWAYKSLASTADLGRGPVFGIVELTDVKISIRGAGQVQKVVSAMLDKELPFTQASETITLTLPQLQEGDVLLLSASTNP